MTFSIVARDPESDAIGIAVHSKFVAVGSVVPFAAADAGAIATQSYANVAYGPDGLDMLRRGADAATVVDELTAADDESATRQVGVVGHDGSIAAFTGDDCLDWAGDRQGDHYTVQGNILEGKATIDAMAEAYESTDAGLPERLLAALHAGNDAGGDSRGEQAASMYVVKPEGGYDGNNDRWIDVRVDDHDSPIDELERVFKLYDVTLLAREPPADPRELEGAPAAGVREALIALGYLDDAAGDATAAFGAADRDALEAFRGANNFENHDLAVIEHALQCGWDATTPGEQEAGEGATDPQQRLVDAIWAGLSDLDRQ
jgi:uncharacterized Ntn-hydrolase superfamily protein